MSKHYEKFKCSVWPLYRDEKAVFVEILDDGTVHLYLLEHGVILTRSAARLLAKRINQALEASKR